LRTPREWLPRLLGINVDVAATWQRATAGDWTTYAADIAQRREPRGAGSTQAGDAHVENRPGEAELPRRI
jgi:hypothetical protein